MSFFNYLKENIRLFLFYIIQIIFISLTIYFDRKNRVLTSNIFYIIFVSMFMFIIYIVMDYYRKSQQVKKLLQSESSKDKTPILPKPIDYKEKIYYSIVDSIYNDFIESIKNIENEFKENKEFMTAWVHEIKTPITTSKLLICSEKESLNVENLRSLEEEIDKIDDYVEKVLYYSRSDNFSKDYIISEINIAKLIKESVKKHSIMFIKKHIKLINEVPETFTVDSDKKWLLFIIDQLVSNALKYTNKNGSITFKIFQDDKQKMLIVQDNGQGIKSEDLKRIFNNAFTGHNGRNKNLKATGMGLYLSQKLAKKLNHYITIESQYGKGTTVIIYFPKWKDYYEVTKM
ncbi:sensor histidine kinase [Clostridium sporogenes]|uniref:sensor histidine kinase n=1 Tax=Clostridium sporogenes TaxID=1509 RepID=UPI0013D12739|nr:HAMP domain-containing sensor histidine kinase [Clostridium sporogenes]NFQ66554.1 HAMP domain-containing histidine kinase [Clostridium sporogenes]